MGLYHGCTISSGYSLFGRPSFIPMRAALWRMKPKMTDFPGLKIPGSEAGLGSSSLLLHRVAHRASALETLLLRWCVTSVELVTSVFGATLA